MTRVRCLSYNVKSGLQGGLDRVAAVAARTSPDIAGFQEVDRDTVRSGHQDQTRELATRLQLEHAVFGPSMPWPGGGQYGVALASRFPLSDVRTHGLWVPTDARVPEGQREPRVLLSATVHPPAERPIRVFVTHLGLSPQQRFRQCREITAAVQQAAVFAPVVLLGDLNAPPDADELAPLWAELHDAHDGVARTDRTTFPAAAPPHMACIVDYVLVGPTTRVTHAEVVRDEEKASDHDLCVADLSL